MKLKLAIIGPRGYPANFPGSSGIDTFIENLIPHLQNKYFINLYTRSWSNPNPQSKSPDLRIIPVPTLRHFLLDTPIYALFAPIIALFQNNDVFWFNAPSCCLLMPLVRLCGKTVIFTSHGIDWQRDKWHFPPYRYTLKFLEFISLKFSNHQTAVSSDIVDYLKQTYSIKATYLPVGSTKIMPFTDLPKYILYLGRIVPEKRIDWIIKAYQGLSPFLQNKYPLIIAGDINHHIYYSRKLTLLTKNNPHITFTGYANCRQKEKYLRGTKLFVLPSNLEGNSLSLNEAIAHNLICLAADLPIHQKIHSVYPNLYLFKSVSFDDFFQKFKSSLNKKRFHTVKSPYPTWKETSDIFITLLNN